MPEPESHRHSRNRSQPLPLISPEKVSGTPDTKGEYSNDFNNNFNLYKGNIKCLQTSGCDLI